MYIYEYHLGGLYTSDEYLSWEDTYCDICEDSDNLVGQADSREEAWLLLKVNFDINSFNGYSYDYVQDVLDGYFGKQDE